MALFALPIVALLQGIFAILHYRLFYKDSPVPKTPSHGVVLVSEDQQLTTTSSCACCAPPRQLQEGVGTSDCNDPLRVLVIGDSLAIGVGQSRSCCPVLPETIAKALCRYFGGRRPVFWSCHGEPGASAGWVVRELEQRLPEKEVANSKSIMLHRAFSNAATITTTTDESCSETSSTTSSISSNDVEDEEDSGNESDSYRKMAFDMPYSKNSAEDNQEVKDEKFWTQRLTEHASCLESNPLDGYYDVVVVMTGSNDLKSAIFPFLLTGDDVEFRKQAQERGGSYSRELCRVMQVLQPRLRKPTNALKSNSREKSSSSPASPRPRLPLVVLPGMPAGALPIFRPYPLHWAAVPFVDYMDRHKQRLAESRPDDVLFVPPPTLQGICEFEAKCDHVLPEVDEFVKLRDMTSNECEKIRDTMTSFCCSSANKSVLSTTRLPLSQRSGQPGTKIFSMDRIHPNDDGYDYWGRFIADAIIREWDKSK
jgi:lysophospholipase L1-like esterase